MRFFFISILLFCFSCFVNASNIDSIKVGILSDYKITTLLISSNKDPYRICTYNATPVCLSDSSFLYKCIVLGDSIEVRSEEKVIGVFKHIEFLAAGPKSFVSMKPVNPDKKVRIFEDDLILEVLNGVFKITNHIALDNYVAGVVESEVGQKIPHEFYKVQSILCRTYVLSHLRRHEAENFNVCDNVHCQAYKGKSKGYESIEKAAHETSNMVIVDDKNELILAAFHSNSGGQTSNCEDVWNKPLPYLRSIIDTFSYSQAHHKWEKKFTIEKWESYFAKNYNFPVQDSLRRNELYSFTCDSRKNMFCNNPPIYLKNMRTELGLNSTFFSVNLINDEVVLSGKGYGHGVGLSQEGAIRMAKLGYTYKQIIHFYYKDVHLIDLRMYDFFKE